jgi:hypothetical protein
MRPKFPTLIFLMMVLTITAILLTSCSQFALLASGSSLVVSQNSYSKIYNAVDILTLMSTEKSMKQQIYEKGKKIYSLRKKYILNER